MGFFRKIKNFFKKDKSVYTQIPYDGRIEQMVRDWVIKRHRGEVFNLDDEGRDLGNRSAIYYDPEQDNYVFIKDIQQDPKGKPIYFIYRISKEKYFEWLQVVYN